MPTIQGDSLIDLVAMTLKDLGENQFTEIATDLQKHIAMRELLKKNRVTVQGYGIQWDVMVQYAANFGFTGLYNQDNIVVGDSMKQATLPWRHAVTSYAIDEREIAMNSQPRKIIDLLKTRRIQAMIAQAEGMETAFWGFPASTDETTPMGVAYHIVKNAVEGFNGGAQTGYNNVVSGIDTTVNPRWKNYTAPFTEISKDDLLPKWRKAATLTNFQPPVEGIPTFADGGPRYGQYTNYAVVAVLEQLLEAQNDNLGNDVASKDGMVTFRRTPVEWVPKLDLDTTNPIYGIPWHLFKTMVLTGRWLKETKITNMPGQHNVAGVFMDSSLNWLLRNRREAYVLSNGTTYPGS